MEYEVRWLAKRGNHDEEYEDAYAADATSGRFAVADGATESAFAATWARSLVQHFVGNGASGPDRCSAWLPLAQDQWQKEFANREFPWYAEAKVVQGAFATFLGVVVSAGTDGRFRWVSTAVGDSCLFHTRGQTLVRAFPIRQSQDFGSSPRLVGSRSPVDEVEKQRVECLEGVCQAGDRLWLMTDALSQWFLQEEECGRKPVKELESLTGTKAAKEKFADWINALRDAKRLRNDDVTLMAIRLETT
jgi:hypothetical protein